MRRLGLCVAVALMMGATTSFAQEGRGANQTSFERLSKYLRLTEAQVSDQCVFRGPVGSTVVCGGVEPKRSGGGGAESFALQPEVDEAYVDERAIRQVRSVDQCDTC